MALHPGERKRHLPEAPVAWDPIRRDLKENEDWYRDLVEHSQDLLCVHDLEGRFLSVNPAPARLLGYSVEEMLRMRLQDVIDPQFRDQCDAYLREIERTGESRGLMAVVTKTGEQRIWKYYNTLRTEGVATPIVRGMAHDVTERVRAEKALGASNQQMLETARERERVLHELTLFRTLLDQSNDAIQVVDPETRRFLDVNERACVELGYSRDELLSMTVFDIDPGYDESSRARIEQLVRESGFATMERVHRRKDGTTFPVEVNLRRVRLDRDYCVAVSRDITIRKRSERALRSLSACNESLMRATDEQSLLNQVCDLVVNVGGYRMAWVGYAEHDERKTIRVAASSGFEAGYLDTMNGTWADEERGRGPTGTAIRTGEVTACRDMTSDPGFAPWREDAIKRGYRSSLALPLKSGEEVLGAITIYATETGVFDAAEQRLLEELSNNLSYGIMAIRARAERKRAEEALHESERRYRLLFSEMIVGFALIEPIYDENGKPCDFRYLEVNPAFETHSGLPRDRVLGKTLREVLPTLDPFWFETYGKVATTGESIHFENYAPPLEKWLELIAFRTHQGHVVVTFADITKRKQSEEAIATLVQVRADSSENFFNSMAVQLAKCLKADYTLIGELIEGEAVKVKTIGVCGQGAIADNFTYDLAHTPSEGVMRQGACSYVAGVSEVFPKDLALKQMKAEGYAGTPLRDSQGRVIGVMVALYTRPLANAKFAEMILQLFSTRTAAEIERKRAEEALRQSEERFRVALKNSPITVFSQDRDLRLTWIYNSRLPQPASEELGKTLGELFDPEEAARMAELRRRVLETGVGSRHEMQISFGGKKRYVDTTIEPVLDSAGAVIGITGASMDVTELREASEALREAKKKLTEEKLYLEQEINTELGFGDIIGQSKALEAVMENVGKVAASDATVLLLGETGTGKELVARAIHWLSLRAGNSFIKLNCAAIPTGLLESELFGNEKGAFTGAVSKKIGRLELADKGTLFLDEIGEISLALQPKLLRVLQDQEFERLGGTHTLKVDFRLIAATNRDLADAVRRNEFRSDLYYRLNVFPIRVPPLRERREDIRLLVEHFVQKFARRMKKSITSIPKRTMDALMGWEWPGNVRELENFIERSVILTQGSVLVAPLSELEPISTEKKSADETLKATEREHILRALRESHGQIGGLRGAAMRLGLKRTTLQSKLKHFGINPRPRPPQP